MLKASIFGLVLAFQCHAFAALNGSWSGNGTYSDNDGYTEELTDDVTITNDGSTITLEESVYGWVTTYDIQGSELLMDGTVVGSFDDKHINVTFSDSDCAQTYTVDLQGKDIAFVDDYTCSDGMFVRVDAILQPAATPALKHRAVSKRHMLRH